MYQALPHHGLPDQLLTWHGAPNTVLARCVGGGGDHANASDSKRLPPLQQQQRAGAGQGVLFYFVLLRNNLQKKSIKPRSLFLV